MATRNRSISGSKKQLKEKIVQIYEGFFRGDDLSTSNPHFWDEFFLLKPKIAVLEAEVSKLSSEQLLGLKENINTLFSKCIATLGHDHQLRVAHSLQTLCALIKSGFAHVNLDISLNIINLLIGHEAAEIQMQLLIEHVSDILTRRLELGQDAVLIVTLLACYRKTGNANSYGVRLSMLDDELALTAYTQVLMASMMVFNERANDSSLLALYQAVHLNRHFVGIIAQSLADLPSAHIEPPPGLTDSLEGSKLPNPNPDTTNSTLPQTLDANTPTNLLATFLEYCSIVMQDTRSEAAYNSTKLCFLILICVSEDEYANALMHDTGITFRIPLHRLPMRHRKVVAEKVVPFRPLVCGLLELIIEFILSHLMKKFPHELYELSLGVIIRVLCHQKRCRLRLAVCPWRDLWAALIALLKFLHGSDALIRKFDVFSLAIQAVNILNLFITFGDTFLPSPQSYDDLYYEIIRMHHVFDNLHAMALRYSTGENEFRESAIRLSAALINVRAIGQHFKPKIELWMESQKLSTPSEEQILEVVRSHYDSLTLKLHESLDAYERYAERPPVAAFLSSILRSVVSVTRSATDPAAIDVHRFLLESNQPPTPTTPSIPL
uniref:EOG090X027A n=1 Tax=Moina brachiata TaxID=675436 RepID=A0A4Y7NI22_9CRUS|nr:EOG090X027A [Moina brachiata]SVE92880.1 EOG090X027A [Moina brachiata]